MKYAIAAIAVVAALAGGAIAQTTETPAAPVAPSACPAYPAAPALPEAAALKRGRTVDQKAVNAQTEKVNVYIADFQSKHACRIAEVRALEAQRDARVAEAKAAQDGVLAYRNSWQTTVESLLPAPAKK
jgi:hypothetical protein